MSSQKERKDSWTFHGVIDPGWRPTKLNERMRTTSEDSSNSMESSPDSPTRRLSITERFLGVGGRRSSASESTDMANKNNNNNAGGQQQPGGITQNAELQNFMKRQRKILGEN